MGPTLSDGLEAVFDAVHDMAEGVAQYGLRGAITLATCCLRPPTLR